MVSRTTLAAQPIQNCRNGAGAKGRTRCIEALSWGWGIRRMQCQGDRERPVTLLRRSYAVGLRGASIRSRMMRRPVPPLLARGFHLAESTRISAESRTWFVSAP